MTRHPPRRTRRPTTTSPSAPSRAAASSAAPAPPAWRRPSRRSRWRATPSTPRPTARPSRSTSRGARIRRARCTSRGRRRRRRSIRACASATRRGRERTLAAPCSARTPTASTARPCSPTTRSSKAWSPTRVVHYDVTADNDSNAREAASPRRSAPRAAAAHAFRWTSYGDLATPDHELGAVVAAEPLRGAGRRALPAAVPPAQRRPLLRQSEPGVAARGVGRLRQQRRRPRPRSVRGCPVPATTKSSSATARRDSTPT